MLSSEKKTIVKKRYLIILLIIAILLLAGCAGNESKTNSPVDLSGTRQEKVEYDGLQIYKDEDLGIKLNYISQAGIEFSVENLSSNIVSVQPKAVALDGQCCIGSYASIESMAPESVANYFLKTSLKNVEHSKMDGIFALIDENGYVIKPIQFSDINIGEKESLEWQPSGKEDRLYSNKKVVCSLLEVNGAWINLEIKNKTDKLFSAFIQTLAIDKKDIGQIDYVNNDNNTSVLPNSTAVLHITLKKPLAEYKQISGVIQLYDIEGNGTIKFPIKIEKTTDSK